MLFNGRAEQIIYIFASILMMATLIVYIIRSPYEFEETDF